MHKSCFYTRNQIFIFNLPYALMFPNLVVTYYCEKYSIAKTNFNFFLNQKTLINVFLFCITHGLLDKVSCVLDVLWKIVSLQKKQ